MTSSPTIAIYGANGHTGRLVARELIGRDAGLVLAGRNETALAEMADALDAPGRVSVQVAAVDDDKALREMCGNAAVVIHCAGPFLHTRAVAVAAADAGCHYVDHAVEPHHVKWLLAEMDQPARQAGIVMIPQMSFYGALADLLAGTVCEGLTDVLRITVGYWISGWRMTAGARHTAELLIGEIDRIRFTDGEVVDAPVEIRNTVFPFPPPIGPRTMIAPFPSGEMLTIPRHVPVRNVESQLSAATFEDPRTFSSQDASERERSQSDFYLAVQAVGDAAGGGRNGLLWGNDIWWVGALASVEAAMRLAAGDGPDRRGVLAAAEAFAPRPFLDALLALNAFAARI